MLPETTRRQKKNGYAWMIYKSGKKKLFVDAGDLCIDPDKQLTVYRIYSHYVPLTPHISQ